MKRISNHLSFIIFTCLVSLCACNKNEYRGYVYDQDKHMPIANVLITYNGQQVRSDSNGYFTLNTNKEALGAIYFYKKGYKPDTIKTVVIHNGEAMEEQFKNGRDTVFLTRLKETPKPPEKINPSSANVKWPITSQQFSKFYKRRSETGEYSLVMPKGFQLVFYPDRDVKVKESPYGYSIKHGDLCVVASEFKLAGVDCKIIAYAAKGENDSEVINTQLNTYDATGQLQDALLLDSRFTFEIVFYREFSIEENGIINLKLYEKELFDYNEQGDIIGSKKNAKYESSSINYKMQPDGTFSKLNI